MEQVQNNEQWKLNGDCNICRRDKYCSKPCKAHRNRVSRAIRQATSKALANVMDK